MTDSHHFAAMMIESAKGALSGFAAAEFTQSGTAEPGGPTFDAWRANLDRRLQELSASLRFEEPQLLAHELRWAEAAFENRGLTRDDLHQSLRHLRSALQEKLPPQAGEPAIDYLDQAVEAITQDDHAQAAQAIDDTTEGGRLALRYLERVLRGSRLEATKLILEAAENGSSLNDLFENVLTPVQREIGNQWHRGELSIAEEHFCTSTTQHTITALIEHSQQRARDGASSTERGVVATAACSGNMHDMPLRILAGVFEESGWRVVQLGCDVPPTEVGHAAEAFAVDLVLLSATLSLHLEPVRQAIRQVRQRRPETRILVGGRIFSALPSLSEKVGADAMAPSAGDALLQADRLLASQTN